MIKILSVVAGCILGWSGLAHAVPIDLTGFKGLEQANLVAGEHGQQGRDNAAFRHTLGSPQNGSNSQAASVPEPSSLLTLGLGLVGLLLWHFRKSSAQPVRSVGRLRQ